MRPPAPLQIVSPCPRPLRALSTRPYGARRPHLATYLRVIKVLGEPAALQGGVPFFHRRLGGLRRSQPIASRVFRICEMEPPRMSLESLALRRVQPSQTLAVTQKARELKRAGKDVISL